MDDVRLSKLLSLVLRHDPGRIGIQLDSAGWVSMTDLLRALPNAGVQVTRDDIEGVVERSDKQRFAIDVETDRIRANQGHSVSVDLSHARAVPPAVLYHGTPIRNLDPILRDGLVRKDRHAVHLSADVETAHRVGARRGNHVILAVAAGDMHAAGFVFTCSANGVWLVDNVPADYLTPMTDA